MLEAVWVKVVAKHVVLRLISEAIRRFKGVSDPWTVVNGPIAAAYASLLHVGWSAISLDKFTDRDGIAHLIFE